MTTRQKLVTLILLAACSAYSGSAYAGNGSHGGGVFDCPGLPVELVDLYEATDPGWLTSDGLQIVRSDAPVQEQIDLAISRLAVRHPKFASQVESAYRLALYRRQGLLPGATLTAPEDLKNGVTKCGTEPKGVALFFDDKLLLKIDQSLYDRMPPTDQAALWVHESVYFAFRDEPQNKLEDSRLPRKIVGYLFSSVSPDNFPFPAESNLARPYDKNPGDLLYCSWMSQDIYLRVSGTCPFTLAVKFHDRNAPTSHAPGEMIKLDGYLLFEEAEILLDVRFPADTCETIAEVFDFKKVRVFEKYLKPCSVCTPTDSKFSTWGKITLTIADRSGDVLRPSSFFFWPRMD